MTRVVDRSGTRVDPQVWSGGSGKDFCKLRPVGSGKKLWKFLSVFLIVFVFETKRFHCFILLFTMYTSLACHVYKTSHF